MRLQVVNDDGPPSDISSPYVHCMISTLQKAGHVVSVVLPNVQRSWIGKAHFIDKVLTPSYFRPSTLFQYDGTVHERPLAQGEAGEEWILVDGTPAACVHLGLWHFFQDRGPVDLVLSGPNYGRNSSTLYQMASGTLGGAMEAANFKKKAIALSFAYSSKENVPDVTAATSRQALRIIEHLCKNWASDVEVYSVKYGLLGTSPSLIASDADLLRASVPVQSDIEQKKVMITSSLENYWTGSVFSEVPAGEDPLSSNAGNGENTLSKASQPYASGTSGSPTHARHAHRHFKWAPRFGDVKRAVAQSEPGNDGWTIEQGLSR